MARPSFADPAFELPLVALVGRANVGKSTLFNRLLRARRALVENRPGVTRDAVASEAEIEGRRVLLVDTGGLDPGAEEGLPAEIALRVRQVVEDAAVVLFVVDAAAGPLPLDQSISELLRRVEGQVVVVANKADGLRQENAAGEFFALGFPEVIPVSAEHRRGLVDLEISIAERLPEAREPAPRSDGGVRVALIGRPNVGKSSLLNRLLGEERSIVSPEPGTTRDALDTRLRVGEDEVVLVDTAGLRKQGRRHEHIERGSAYMALRAIERADVVLLLLDVLEGVTEQDAKIARLALDRGRPIVLVQNKWDAVERGSRVREIERQFDRRLSFVPDPVVLRISARTGRGTAEVLPRALALHRESRHRVSTSELNRALREAIAGFQPPMSGRRRARFFYGTQVSERPFTVLLFMNDPALVPENYRRYLESSLRKRFGIRSAPVRVRLRARSRSGDEGVLEPGERPPRR